MMIYTQNKILCASLCGADARLSCIGAFSLVEDALTELMGELKIDGLTAMQKYNAIWLFTKNHTRFIKPISWMESIKVESYIAVKTRARIYIDVCIKNAANEICVYARIELCGIDRESGRIRRVDTVGVDESVVVETAQSDVFFFKKEDVTTEHIDSVKVSASNIDYVHHTNNVEYIRFLINTFSCDDLLKDPVKEIEVCYLNQSFEGDRLDIYKAQKPGGAVFDIVKGDVKILNCEMLF